MRNFAITINDIGKNLHIFSIILYANVHHCFFSLSSFSREK